MFGLMFAMGLTLTSDDFRRISEAPRATIVGTALQLLVMPIVGILIARIYELTPVLTAGLVVLAATSHLPHLLSYALVDVLVQSRQSEDIFRYAAGGFADFSRLASSDPTMWADIFIANSTVKFVSSMKINQV